MYFTHTHTHTHTYIYIYIYIYILATGWTVRDRIPVWARFSPPVQTGPGAHPTSCKMVTESFPGVNSGRGVTLTSHHVLVPLVMKK
jgi:hypothetical protein